MRFVFLDILRIFASFSVLFGHNFSGFLQSYIETSSHFSYYDLFILNIVKLLRFITEKGGSGVIVFFLISGYIIRHSLEHSSASSFLIRRFFRIYPLYIFACISEQLLNGIDVANLVSLNFSAKIFLIGDLFGIPYGLGNVEWTLRIEMYFYILMAFAKYTKVFYNPLFCLNFVTISLLFLINDPIPSFSESFYGYISLYLPLLFIGCLFYTVEFSSNSRFLSLISIFIIYIIHVQNLINFEKSYVYFRFLHVGLVIWCAAWYVKDLFKVNMLVTFLSNLTFSIYLFHNWMPSKLNIIVYNINISFIIFFIFCAFVFYAIEYPFIFVGRFISNLAADRPR